MSAYDTSAEAENDGKGYIKLKVYFPSIFSFPRTLFSIAEQSANFFQIALEVLRQYKNYLT